MHTPPSLLPGFRAWREGFALVLVMIALALITLLTVFFLSSIGRERRGVDQYSRSTEVRQLADKSVNLVIGQINAATKEGTAAVPVSWASQPGMIRTYNTSGTLSKAYKLYSWDNMVASGGSFNPTGNAGEYPSSNWFSTPALYTDLNAPVNNVYPIVDPTVANAGKVDPDTFQFTLNQAGSVTWDFPAAFSYLPEGKGYAKSDKSDANILPMPVKWIYVLQDGTWAAPTGGDPKTATFEGLPAAQKPTNTNPIVGRIAFWTDDETSKVNINTASEGSFWDTPKAATMDELQFAGNPPVKGEYQRISGHPATTSLSAVFPETRDGTFNKWSSVSGAIAGNYVQQMQDVFSLTPRIAWGGSQAGTFPIGKYTQTYPPPEGTAYISEPVPLDTNRLYATADDVWFQPTGSPTQDKRDANSIFATTRITPERMASRLFFLTANSRAPETTLFETPRISLWPVTWPFQSSTYYVSGARTSPTAPVVATNASNIANNKWMTYQEKLLAFCSTLNQNTSSPQPYYFQRQNPDSPTYDWSNFERNRNLAGYLSREMGSVAPGTGGGLSLKSKFGLSSDWIALNCLDFSRSLVNQYTYSQTAGQATDSGSDYLYSYTGLQFNYGKINGVMKSNYAEPNAYTVSPLHVNFNNANYTTQGAFPALKEANLVFYATNRREPRLQTTPNPDPDKPPIEKIYGDPKNWDNLISYGTGVLNGDKSQTTQMQAVMLLSFSGMNPGVWSFRGQTYYAPVFWVKVSRVKSPESFQVNGVDINFPKLEGNSVQYSALHNYKPFMSSMASSLVATGTAGSNAVKEFTNAGSGFNVWSLVSDPITVSPDSTLFDFKGTAIQVDIYACVGGNVTADPTTGTHPELLISSQQINFSEWSTNNPRYPKLLPIPLAPRWNVRQAASVKMPSTVPVVISAPGVTPLVYSKPDDPTVAGWATEIVPTIGQYSSMDPSKAISAYDPRVSATTYRTVDGYNDNSGEPLVYAYLGKTVDSADAPDSSHFKISPSFKNRITANRNSPLYYAEKSTGQLFSGLQPTTPVQAYQLVTPYDTAISMVTDPRAESAGDPRLMGRGISTSDKESGSTSFVRIDYATNSILPSNTLDDPLANLGIKPLRVTLDGVNGKMFERSTSQWQHHSLSTTPTFRTPTGYFLGYQYTNPDPQLYSNAIFLANRGTFTQSDGAGSPVGYLLGRDTWDATVGVESNVTNVLDRRWDWTALPGNFSDGGYIARPDQEYQTLSPKGINGLRVPYFNDSGLATTVSGATVSGANTSLSLNVFMPNRQIPSPIVLGTLPASMTKGWLTLNFCPNPAMTMNTTAVHPGPGVATTPTTSGPAYTTLPDHLLLDLFWMPVAEPYPISDQLSTAGKINLNYAMMPFPYIQRKTGLDAVLKSVWLAALPTPVRDVNNKGFAQLYKSYGLLYRNNRLDQTNTRFPVNPENTLKAFDYKFSKGDIFRSASQICDVFLYPNDPNSSNRLAVGAAADAPPNVTNIRAWWNGKAFTSDNAREDPYSAIYSRITTKSNTFTVHWKVQTLQKRPGSDADAKVWTEGRDSVASELRGSSLIERYINPNATDIPDYADPIRGPEAQPLTQFYKWRTVSENYFHP